jgi:DNA (cytosine-5)-methyltransferase 1
MWRLIRDGRPDTFFGEQVTSADGKVWLALVRASLEILGYAVGGTDTCSAGVGASDIRQRLYFVADSMRTGRAEGWTVAGNGSFTGSRSISDLGQPKSNRRKRRKDDGNEGRRECSPRSAGSARELEQPNGAGSFEGRETGASVGYGNTAITTGGAGVVGDSKIKRERPFDGQSGESIRQEITARGPSFLGELADTHSLEPADGGLQRGGRLLQPSENPLAGFWSNAEWIYCQDGKYRAVEPGTFPLAHGVPARVGRLRAYGNAINVEVAKTFIEAYMDTLA